MAQIADGGRYGDTFALDGDDGFSDECYGGLGFGGLGEQRLLAAAAMVDGRAELVELAVLTANDLSLGGSLQLRCFHRSDRVADGRDHGCHVV